MYLLFGIMFIIVIFNSIVMIESNEISPFTLFVNKTMGKETPVEKDSVETQSKISLETF